MATVVQPRRDDARSARTSRRRANRLPAVRDYEQVDREIIGTLRPTLGWFAALGIAILCLLIGVARLDLPDPRGARRRRLPPAGDVGRLHHHLRVLGRYRPRRHADLGDSVPVPRRLPHDDLPRCRSDDGVRRHDGGTLPDPPPRAAVEVLLADPVSELAAHLAESKSPLVWDVFAILTYLTVSATFLYVGLIPDIAVLRDRETNPVRKRIFAALVARAGGTRTASGATSRARTCSSPRSPRRSCSPCTPSCRSTSRWRSRPGWHATIFPPYFVAGAIFSGIGMVFTIIIPIRKFFKLQHYVTINDLDAAAKLCLFTSMVVGLAYLTEFQVAWMSRQQVRAGVLLEPRVRPVGVGRVDHADLQHGPAALALLAEAAAQHDLAVHPLDLHQHRDVVRAVRDRRPVALARVRAVAVGRLRADLGRLLDPARLVRLVLHVVPALHQAAARHGDRRDQGDRPAEDAEARRSRGA